MATQMVSRSVTDRIPENVSIRKLLNMNNGTEYHVSIPKKWKESLGLSGYLKLTKMEQSISIERLSL
jgi:hypothetical protein